MTTSNRVPSVTLQQVAEAAEVSLKTASRVFNGEPYVAVATRERVLAAARRLDFQINGSASMLSRGIGDSGIALIIGDITNPFYAALARGAESETRARGSFLTLASSDESEEEEQRLLQEFTRRHVRGIILASTLDDHAALDAVQMRGASLVFVDRPPIGITADSVLLDNFAGARSAAQHLIAHGHREIALVGDYGRLSTHQERLRGFADAMAAIGVTDWRAHVHDGAHDVASATALVSQVLSADNPPTAILASNNRIAIGAVSAITAVRPGTALIGFDDFDLADVLGVTTVSHDPVAMGRIAAERLFDRSAQGEGGADARQVVLPTSVTARGSGERAPLG